MSLPLVSPAQSTAPTQIAVVLVNLGSPEAPTRPAVRRFLKQQLSDPRHPEAPRFLRWLALNAFRLPFGTGNAARRYASIWNKEGSPLLLHTQKQAKLLRGYLGERGHDVRVAWAMRYGQPSLAAILDQLVQDGCNRILILPAFPQYSSATTASVFDAVFAHCATLRNIPELRLVKEYHDHERYIGALSDSLFTHWETNGRPDRLLMSFRSLPNKTHLQGDPYYDQCLATARLLAEQLQLSPDQYLVSFQAQRSNAKWLQPSTKAALHKLARSGGGCVDVICPGFTADCLSTLGDMAIEGRQTFLMAGGKEFRLVPCLNESDSWLHALAQIAEENLLGWPTMVTATAGEQRGTGLPRANSLLFKGK